ncbi:Acid phosphatase 1 [Melia azedarach]|uniref:Acid phosphatase 1 n=1 Tax=Melia azedarach TaxID=155640 RepID=A0ACC1Y332_MELAZ|nr:Acid phosphatase 1 [Melia azedarach]
MGVFSFFVFLATISAISHQVSGLHIPNILRKTVSNTEPDPDFSCLSWRFGVETNNIRDWKTVPKVCEEDVKIYMSSFSPQYEDDSRAVVLEAFQFAGSLKLAEDGKDIWIFDIDETSLSDLPFYAQHGYGDASYLANTTIEYKSNERRKLEESGHRIIGNIGDQRSDLLGSNPGNRTFKLPNPMYYKP